MKNVAVGRRAQIVLGALLASVAVAGVAAVLFVVVGAARTATAPSRTTDTWSRSLPDAKSKLEFLERYMKLMSPVKATEFHIVFHDNDWAPSDWDMRVALKVEPSDVGRWTDGMAAHSSPAGFDWVRSLVPDSAEWAVSSSPDYYQREGCSLRVHAPEGVLFKMCSTLRSP